MSAIQEDRKLNDDEMHLRADETKNTENILVENRVAFTETQDNGLVTRRQHVEVRAPHTTYTASTSATFEPVLPPPIDITFSVAPSDYIDGKSSWLYFNLTTNRTGDVNYSYGNGSALNWISGIKLISGDGQTIDDLTQTNLFMSFRDRWSKSSGYFNAGVESVGEIKGYGNTTNDGGFACPLNELLPLFDYDGLLPANVIDKMRIIITLAPPHELLTRASTETVADLTYTLSDVRLMLDTYTMDYRLVEMINQSEFVIEYDTYKTQFTPYTGRELRMPLQYSVSKAKKAFVVTRYISTEASAEAIELEDIEYDFMAGEFTMALDNYRWRIGNRYQPNIPIKTDVDAFGHALTVWNKLSTNNGNLQISPASFQSTQNCFCVNLRRAGSGTPINSGNELELQLEHSDTLKREAFMFCEYTKKLVVSPVTASAQLAGLWNRVSILE